MQPASNLQNLSVHHFIFTRLLLHVQPSSSEEESSEEEEEVVVPVKAAKGAKGAKVCLRACMCLAAAACATNICVCLGARRSIASCQLNKDNDIQDPGLKTLSMLSRITAEGAP